MTRAHPSCYLYLIERTETLVAVGCTCDEGWSGELALEGLDPLTVELSILRGWERHRRRVEEGVPA